MMSGTIPFKLVHAIPSVRKKHDADYVFYLLTALLALLLRLFGETRLGHPFSDQRSLLNREQDRFWMGGQKGRGGLFRLEKEGLRAKGLS